MEDPTLPQKSIRFQLTLTEHQCRVLTAALDLYSRIGCGQIQEIVDHHAHRVSPEVLREVETHLDFVHEKLTGLPSTANFGIGSAQIVDQYRAAYDIHQVVRAQLLASFGGNPKSPGPVVHWSLQPMPTIKEVSR